MIKRSRTLIPLVIELMGIAGIGCGIGIEVSMGADIGYIAITVGSVLVAVGGVVWGKFIRQSRSK